MLLHCIVVHIVHGWGLLLFFFQDVMLLPVFQSHGKQDELLPHEGAERLRDTLIHAGLPVEWHSFRGGHEIPRSVLQRLGPFITKVVTKT